MIEMMGRFEELIFAGFMKQQNTVYWNIVKAIPRNTQFNVNYGIKR